MYSCWRGNLSSASMPYYNKTVEEIAPDTSQFLERYVWSGNVQELKNVIQRAVLMSRDRVLTADLIPDRVR